MTLAALLLAAAVIPAAQEGTPRPETAAAEPAGSPQAHIDAGLREFRRRRFARAQEHFEQAVQANPDDAAATFYLAYTVYKIAEPKRPFHPDKQKAAELFAKAYSLDPNFKPVWHR
ncbi:MAG TPA: tetratricopeptide repeat protein [Vicinamibacteria bacterium]|jgi:tetratricopeptide (TPR) repeat protein